MDNHEAIERLKQTYCCNRGVCELHSVDLCQKEKCEIWMAISALQEQDSETRSCDTCKHDPPSNEWPCVDCDMREPADRWEPQEQKHSTELSLTQNGLDTISRTAAIDAVEKESQVDGAYGYMDTKSIIDLLNALPSAQSEPSIPISWIEKEINWLKSMDNGFSNIAAMNISVFVKKWRKENGKDEGSD